MKILEEEAKKSQLFPFKMKKEIFANAKAFVSDFRLIYQKKTSLSQPSSLSPERAPSGRPFIYLIELSPWRRGWDSNPRSP